MAAGSDVPLVPELIPPERARAAAELLSALASPSRIRILDRLRQSACTVGELAEAVGMEQSAVSNHLRVLRHMQLVEGERQGRNIRYALHDEHVATLLTQTLSHLDHLRS